VYKIWSSLNETFHTPFQLKMNIKSCNRWRTVYISAAMPWKWISLQFYRSLSNVWR